MGNQNKPKELSIDDLLEGIQDVDIPALPKSSTKRNLVNDYGEVIE